MTRLSCMDRTEITLAAAGAESPSSTSRRQGRLTVTMSPRPGSTGTEGGSTWPGNVEATTGIGTEMDAEGCRYVSTSCGTRCQRAARNHYPADHVGGSGGGGASWPLLTVS